jgi:hypothetical protein
MTTETNAAPEGVSEDTAAALDSGAEDQTLAQGDEHSGDDAAAAQDGEDGQPAKPRKSAQDRIDELTRARREAERDRDYYRELSLRQPQAPQTQPQAQAPAAEQEPDPAAYEHGELDTRFIRDHAVFHARQAFRSEMAQQARQTQTQSALSSFEQRVGEQYPDGEPAGLQALRRMPSLPEAIQEVLLTSEIGPKLADHLGQNTREFQRISALPPIQQARELTKLEIKLATPPAPAKTATDAPAPAPQVRGLSGRFTVAPDTNDFAAFEKQYGN